ncbi:MAG: hypothetical protein IJ418_17640 [Clostridia bacterium]|nr:hypothetical protein [Clostridia bacterium]
MHKSQIKVSKRNPDYLLVIDQIEDSSYRVVPCWITDPGFTLCIFAVPQNLYVDAKAIFMVSIENLIPCENITLMNIDDALNRIKAKNQEIRDKKHLAKVQRTKRKQEAVAKEKARRKAFQERKERIENTYGREYELAVINNDRKRMREIEEKIGYDPRRQLGVKSGGKLEKVVNFKPCIGGRVSPK